MAPAYRTPPRTVVKGGTLAHGMLIKGVSKMNKNQMQRPLNSSMHADKIGRDGRVAKNLPDTIPTVPGQRSRIQPSHDYLHGAPLDDEKQPPIKSYEKPIPIHGGMTSAQHDKFHGNPANSAALILTDAANLGKPPEEK